MRSILQLIKFEDEANQDNSLFNVISKKHRKNMTNYFWADLIYRVHSKKINNFFCLFIWGEQGTAKSGVGQLIMQVLFKNFSQEQVVFTNEALREKMNKIEKGEALLRDEYQKVFGEGSYQLQATIENYARQLRERGNSFIYIQPDYMEIKNFHYFIRTIHFDENKRLVTAGLQNPSTNAYLGYVDFNLNPIWNNDFWKEYEKRKKEFVDVVSTNTYSKLDTYKIAKEIITNNKEFISKCYEIKNKKIKAKTSLIRLLVFKKSPNLTTAQNSMIVQEIKFILENERT